MTNEKIKEMLLDIEGTGIDFTVTQSGKASQKVNGLYYPNTHEIVLHNKNFTSDNLLMYTAVHEYTHHLMSEELFNTMGVNSVYNAKCHTQKFWAKFDTLLCIAEKKGYYNLSLEASKELQELTQKIKSEYLEKNAILMQQLGGLLYQAKVLCEKANVRYEDYIDRVLLLPRKEADTICLASNMGLDAKVGYENMKMLSKIDDDEERTEAQNSLLSGHSPVSVKQMIQDHIKQNKGKEEDDEVQKLTAEKSRIQRTIDNLNKRLKVIEEALNAL